MYAAGGVMLLTNKAKDLEDILNWLNNTGNKLDQRYKKIC